MGKMIGLKDKKTGELLVVFGLVREKAVSHTGVAPMLHCRYLRENILGLRKDYVYATILDKAEPKYLGQTTKGEVPMLVWSSELGEGEEITAVWDEDIPPEILLSIKMEKFSSMDTYKEVKE